MKRLTRVNTRDIHPGEAQVSTDYDDWWRGNVKKVRFQFLEKTEVKRSEIRESEVGEEVE